MYVIRNTGARAKARVLETRRWSSTVSPNARHNPRQRPPIPGSLALVASCSIVGLFYYQSSQGKDILHADSSVSNASSTREVVVLEKPVQQMSGNEGKSSARKSYSLPTLPDWTSIKASITDAVLPSWAKQIPGYYDKLSTELSQAPGSLADEIWREAHDPTINPEIVRNAVVRVSSELCDEEKAFLKKRRWHTRRALATYLGVSDTEIHPDDVPTIAMCGSGGGLRALVAGTSSYFSAQEAGLFDIVTYTAGVSGSCWLQSLYYSSITGQKYDRLIDHLKHRLNVHIAFPPPLLQMLTTNPTSKYLLSGGYEKYKGVKDADFGLVDVYGVLLGARLLVPNNELSINNLDLKISNQRRFINEGQHPLPIYTAVRHDIPREAIKAELKQQEAKAATAPDRQQNKNKSPRPPTADYQAYRPDFQWLEWTPYEFWCEDFGAGIPTWSIGRQFEGGKTVWRDDSMCLPELRLPLLMGIFGSAFCATLSHYYKEMRPLVKGLTGLGMLDETLTEKDEDLIKIHPVSPAQVPNFALGMRGRLPETCPVDAPSIQLMDAGMSNNLPIYPLLRPGRDVDILVAFDASADVRKDNWLRVAEGYSRQRGHDKWPAGSGWPAPENLGNDKHPDFAKDVADSKRKESTGSQNAQNSNTVRDPRTTETPKPMKNLLQLFPSTSKNGQKPQSKVEEPSEVSMPKNESSPVRSDPSKGSDLGYCTVWIGDTASPDKVYSASSSSSPHDDSSYQHPSTSTRFKPKGSTSPPLDRSASETTTNTNSSKTAKSTKKSSVSTSDKDEQNHNPLHSPTAGLAVVYFPLIPNPSVPSIDPQKSDFMSTWNFVYTPEQVDDVVSLARANFKEGEELVREVVRGVWERKRAVRLGVKVGAGWDGGSDRMLLA